MAVSVTVCTDFGSRSMSAIQTAAKVGMRIMSPRRKRASKRRRSSAAMSAASGVITATSSERSLISYQSARIAAPPKRLRAQARVSSRARMAMAPRSRKVTTSGSTISPTTKRNEARASRPRPVM